MKNMIARFTSINCFIALTMILANVILPNQIKAQDNPAIKNENPCIEEICINDEVKNLPNLKWEKVLIKSANYKNSLKAVGDANAIKTFSKYLNAGKIDGIGLQALSKIEGFCEQPTTVSSLGLVAGSTNRITGSYTNKKGQSVIVYFRIVPSADGKSQKFIVTEISKIIQKTRITPEQYNDLVAQAKTKYKNYYQDPNTSPKYPNVILASSPAPYLHLKSQFGQMFNGEPINPSMFQYFPGCGADKKINL